MVKVDLKSSWRLKIPTHLAEMLFRHLFPGDNDEHGAIIQAGIAQSVQGLQLLVRDVILAKDGIDYVPGRHGYRMLTGEFVTKQALLCRNEQLVYLAVHNHGGKDYVQFSDADLASHRRGYPALLDVMRGVPVGALVFTENAVAGELWLSPKIQIPLESACIIGQSLRWLHPSPLPRPVGCSSLYDRQARIFGDRGQNLLERLKVGVIGAGGAGSLIVEYLGRLGVGYMVIADPERVELSNVPRITGSTRFDAMSFLTKDIRPEWLRRLGRHLSTPKVKVMKRLVSRANPAAHVDAIMADIVDDQVARRFTDCDYIFLAADSMKARLVFNSIVHNYLIPGVQVGAKVPIDKITGNIGDVFTVVRPVTPSNGCLWCNGLITPEGLQRELETVAERKSQRYIDDDSVIAPSVITLNATAASHAVNDFLFLVMGLTDTNVRQEYMRSMPRKRSIVFDKPRRDQRCPHCSVVHLSSFARGDNASLPTRTT